MVGAQSWHNRGIVGALSGLSLDTVAAFQSPVITRSPPTGGRLLTITDDGDKTANRQCPDMILVVSSRLWFLNVLKIRVD